MGLVNLLSLKTGVGMWWLPTLDDFFDVPTSKTEGTKREFHKLHLLAVRRFLLEHHT